MSSLCSLGHLHYTCQCCKPWTTVSTCQLYTVLLPVCLHATHDLCSLQEMSSPQLKDGDMK